MTRRLDLEFLEATVLRRTRRGGVAQRDDPDEYGLRQAGLSDRGENRYRELVRAQPTPLRVPASGHPTGAETGVGARRGWCVAGCGCSLDVPPGGAVYVDCPACELPATTQTPAGCLAPGRPRPDGQATVCLTVAGQIRYAQLQQQGGRDG